MRPPSSSDALQMGCALAILLVSPMLGYAAGEPGAGRDELAACALCSPVSQGMIARGPSRAGGVERSGGAAAGHSFAATDYTPDERMYESILSSGDRGSPSAYPEIPEADGRGDVSLSQPNSFHSRTRHRLSRGCAFHFTSLRDGLRC